MPHVTLVDQRRTGLFPEHAGVAAPDYEVRATLPALELLRSAGAQIERVGSDAAPTYRVTLGATMPAGLVAAHVNGPPYVEACLRLASEPEWPGEHPDYWAQVAFTPCPVCGAPVIWYEAGYAPGYRVCSRPPYHHSQARP